MTKIFFIVPYEELEVLFREEASVYNVSNIVCEFKHIYGSDYTKLSSIDADIIVARGITARAVEACHPDANVIPIPMGTNDLLEALYKSREHSAKCIGLLAESREVCDAAHVSRMIGKKVIMYIANDQEEVRAGIDLLRFKGCSLFVGGLTMARICEEKGYDYISIQTGRHAVKRVVRDAIASARSLEKAKVRTNLLVSLLNKGDDAIVAIDSKGMVMESNLLADNLFGKKLTGTILEKVYCNQAVNLAMELGTENEFIDDIGKDPMFITCQPIGKDPIGYKVLLIFHRIEAIRNEESKIRRELSKKGLIAHYTFGNIITDNAQMKLLILKAKRYASVEGSILLVGETGTGKEMFAQSIHNASSRRNGPFVALNCAALSEQLLESELFGYAPGAFTGARKEGKVGLFELAHTGTIFLDEIGEMPIQLQAKLLRVLQEHEIMRVGGDSVIPVDVRVISATNVDISERIKHNTFRLDLFYRLGLFILSLPPLRSRESDIPLLFTYFLRQYCIAAKREVPRLTTSACRLLEEYAWPGNIRELKNGAQRLAVLNRSSIVDETAVRDLDINTSMFQKQAVEQKSTRKMSACEIAMLYKESGLSKEEFAEEFDMSRTTLWRKLSEAKK
ncbi:MAG: sigma 54-interacting transcriptional regulator [Spirochaetia bacterium]|jgi:propionate catabolism operon transcriptional regulator|nr:sigma 54-interacting transcriptional regulator [Spirochaetia bacterium]